MHFKHPFLSKEFVYKTSRSGGAGGQNVNKVATKVHIDFAISTSIILTEIEKKTLLEKLATKLTNDGLLQVVSQTERTQFANKEIAIKKIYQILNKCFVVKKKRKPSKPTKGSIAKRLNTKKRDSELKQNRQKIVAE